MKKINVAIIGAGLIGKKRAEALTKIPSYHLTAVYDVNQEVATSLAQAHKCEVRRVEEIIEDPKIDLVILAIRHKDAAQLALRLVVKKNLLIEKPLGRDLAEASEIIAKAKKFNNHLFVGFNYHYYPHIQLAKSCLQKRLTGELISSTFKIGHAATPGYDKTWKMSKNLCGGGVILDPGVHMIDLMIMLLGTPTLYSHYITSKGWRSEVEDEALIVFTGKDKSVSFHHYSLNLSQNTFFIEFVGTKGIIRVNGRGGNYGDMEFQFIPKWFWNNKRKVIIKNFGRVDSSFYEELKDISRKLRSTVSKNKDYSQYFQVMSVVDSLYKNYQQ